MAGNPLAKLFPYVKKYAVELYLGIGVLAFVKHHFTTQKTFSSVYSKNEFERKYYLEKLRELVIVNNKH